MIFYIILLIFCNYSNGETITVDDQLSKIEDKIKHIIDRENYINNRLDVTKNEINIQKKNLEKLLQKKLDVLAIEQQNTIDKYNKLFGKKKQLNDEYNKLFIKRRQLNEVEQIQSNYIDYTVPLRVPIFSLVLFSICIMPYGFIMHLNKYCGSMFILCSVFGVWILGSVFSLWACAILEIKLNMESL